MTRDRDGSHFEDDEATYAALPSADRHYCQSGWTGEDAEGRPVPCLICKPYLSRSRRPWQSHTAGRNTP